MKEEMKLLKGWKTSLDITWLKDKSLADLATIPPRKIWWQTLLKIWRRGLKALEKL
jgi:hypothetical protein